MKSKALPRILAIKFFLIGLITALLLLSVFCDYRQQKKLNVDRLRDQLPFTDLIKLESGDYMIERSQLEKYLHYFQSVSENDLSRADAYALEGFCYFHSGEIEKAQAAYQKAVDLDPKVLSFHYNLAVIAFLQGRHQQSFEGFKAALKTSRSDNFDFLRNSKILVYIVYKAHLSNQALGERLKRNYSLSAYYIIESLKKSGDLKQAEVFRQQMSAAGMEIPKNQEEPQLKVF